MRVIDDDQLYTLALDDSEVRGVAARSDDPDKVRTETRMPAPGFNVREYFHDIASRPAEWTRAELNLSRDWHHPYMKIVERKINANPRASRLSTGTPSRRRPEVSHVQPC